MNQFGHIDALTANHECKPNEVVAIGVNQVADILDREHYWWAALIVIMLLFLFVNATVGYSRRML